MTKEIVDIVKELNQNLEMKIKQIESDKDNESKENNIKIICDSFFQDCEKITKEKIKYSDFFYISNIVAAWESYYKTRFNKYPVIKLGDDRTDGNIVYNDDSHSLSDDEEIYMKRNLKKLKIPIYKGYSANFIRILSNMKFKYKQFIIFFNILLPELSDFC